jgi:hypothetical protein
MRSKARNGVPKPRRLFATSTGHILGQRFDAGGNAVGGAFVVNALGESFQASGIGSPSIELRDDGALVAVWSRPQTGAVEQKIISDLSTQVTYLPSVTDDVVNTSITGAVSGAPEATRLADGGHLVVWSTSPSNISPALPDPNSGIYAQRYDAAGNKVGSEFLVNTTTEDYDALPTAVGFAQGGFVVAWMRQIDGQTDIVAQLFNASSDKIGGELLLNQLTDGQQNGPAVTALADGKFAVMWTSSPDLNGSDYDVKARVFNADGTPATAEFTVNQKTAFYQIGAGPGAITTLAGGRFAVTWYSTNFNNTYDAYVRVFNADGSAASDEVLAHSSTQGDQIGYAVGALTGGGFVASWTDNNGSIRAQRFDADGVKVGTEFQVNPSLGGGSQYEPEVQGLSDGGFVVIWTFSQFTTSVGHILGQRFDAAGNAVGGAFVVNDIGESFQAKQLTGPSLELRGDGALVAVWHARPVPSNKKLSPTSSVAAMARPTT